METPAGKGADGYGFNFDNSYLKLPSIFYKTQQPTPVNNPEIALFNDSLALELGLNVEALKKNGSQFLAGNVLVDGSEPIAQAYAGHQFGHFNILGDGRAILLGEHVTFNKQRVDIQLKGSGRTPYSRSGDGRAALAPMLREYVMSEAMVALGIPTTRSLAVTTTGEAVYRNFANPGAVLTRIAASHIRVGTFQFAATTQNPQELKALADYTINRHFSNQKLGNQALTKTGETDNPYLKLLTQVIDLQASLIAKWMHVGFIHGVMNTDNMSICGETIDYGPCAFMNAYHPETVFSSIDANGRYAYGNQPKIAHWNLIRFAETLLPLIDESEEKSIALVTEYLQEYPNKFLAFWLAGMRKKLGIFNQEEDDLKLAEDLLVYMQKNKADFTNTFRYLAKSLKDEVYDAALYQDVGFKNWLTHWKARLSRQSESVEASIQLMNSVNPKVIPRNHLVEEALNAAVDNDDMTLINDLLLVLSDPYADLDHPAKYTQTPEPLFDAQYKTYCGT
ncbi:MULTISPECIES: protein adenylyltransferase SelO [Methylotenera]|uniref:protein adenylyltransferase SelO n=1 Tax=Methylotenera TaxID=359407 RepID=UPI000377CB7E|nr:MULTISPECIES: YdiU family protein [Methylotenera]